MALLSNQVSKYVANQQARSNANQQQNNTEVLWWKADCKVSQRTLYIRVVKVVAFFGRIKYYYTPFDTRSKAKCYFWLTGRLKHAERAITKDIGFFQPRSQSLCKKRYEREKVTHQRTNQATKYSSLWVKHISIRTRS